MTTFQEVIDRAAREHWPFWRVIDEIELLPEPEKSAAVTATFCAIAAELDRRCPMWRERVPSAH